MVRIQHANTRKKWLLLAGGLIVIIIAYAVTAAMAHWWPLQKNAQADIPPTAQSSFTGGDNKSNATNNNSSNAALHDATTDTNGTIPSTPPSSQWSTSKDGTSIVVYSPAVNGVFSSGDSVYGTAAGSSVSYRLVDDEVGVIDEGSLTVSGGKFSGTFTFHPTSTTGQIDIFDQAADGTESNDVTIPVRFGP